MRDKIKMDCRILRGIIVEDALIIKRNCDEFTSTDYNAGMLTNKETETDVGNFRTLSSDSTIFVQIATILMTRCVGVKRRGVGEGNDGWMGGGCGWAGGGGVGIRLYLLIFFFLWLAPLKLPLVITNQSDYLPSPL
jgi:hypothetical protein